ncbi:hypothetical protein BBO99_00007996 [Phytophthora kernoviae]|uniref:Amino acid transporter n=2 Tax=Phytophthora kernoviae TaxID=325452 RepID=A0A3R7GUS1_9STRA|nr:hypothetical protein G195_009140 [Phytophthora kernoviae 00238/432]KAG2516487.1 hypothetical protein JM16_007641 [Phytophthora kernoviae]KAG2519421.1 hypothetical protein JM18_007548 [Phytophthora kernoviae]RLN37299.1 hypothetical protein BBI17_007947 [Phytophthora kernoviae]RLN75870.1 hypothetical protein BBO99_00007996 [Phytophthora kernoviae]
MKDDGTASEQQPALSPIQDEVSESPDAAFRDFRTPAHEMPPFGGLGVGVNATTPQLQTRASKRNMIFILLAIMVGGIVGMLLKHYEINTTAAKWIMTPGNLFVRAVQCVVVPMVFVNLVVATADIMYKGLGKSLSIRVVIILLLSIFAAIAQGILTGVVTHSLFRGYSDQETTSSTDVIFGIQCGNGKFLEANDDGAVTCSATSISGNSQFALDDVNDALVRNEALTGTNSSLSDNVIAVIDTFVPSNLMASFIDNTLLSIVAFALPLGVTLAASFHGPVHLNPLLEFFREVNETLVHMAHWILGFTPFAVLSLLAGSLATSLEDSVAEHPVILVLQLVATVGVSVLVHMLVVLPVFFVLFTRRNPFRFMRQMLPAYVYSLGCSSSMATMPMSLECIETSREVPSSVMHFVLSVGTVLHMPGVAIYLAVLLHFMADVAGVTGEESTTTMLVTFLGVFLCTLSAPPIPAGAFAVLAMAWNIVFPAYAIPDSVYALTLAADVFLDRFVTLCNVNAQAMLCRVLADQVNETHHQHATATQR